MLTNNSTSRAIRNRSAAKLTDNNTNAEMRTVVVLMAVVLCMAVLVSASEEERGAKPCKKKESTEPKHSIEQIWPVLVTDYHPVAINPNSVPDKVADRTARAIVREHAQWERDNPAPPKMLSTSELKDAGIEIAKQTQEIKKEGRAFRILAKKVEHEHESNLHAEKQAKLKAAAAAKDAALAAQKKAKQDAEVKKSLQASQKLKAHVAAQKAAKKIAALKKKAKGAKF